MTGRCPARRTWFRTRQDLLHWMRPSSLNIERLSGRRWEGQAPRGGCLAPARGLVPHREFAFFPDAFVQFRQVLVFVEVQRDRFTGPAGQVNGVRQTDAVDAVRAWCDEWRAVENVRGEVLQDSRMLGPPLGLELDDLRRVVVLGVELAGEQFHDVLHVHALAELTLRLLEPSHGGGQAVVDNDLAVVT